MRGSAGLCCRTRAGRAFIALASAWVTSRRAALALCVFFVALLQGTREARPPRGPETPARRAQRTTVLPQTEAGRMRLLQRLFEFVGRPEGGRANCDMQLRGSRLVAEVDVWPSTIGTTPAPNSR